MKLLRIWLLVLLALLLPVRGALAAAMLCPTAGAGMQQTAVQPMDHASHDHHHADHTVHAEGGVAHIPHPHGDTTGHDDGDTPGQDKCNLCAGFCSLTPMLSAFAGVPEPRGLAHAPFPAISAPAPSFLSGGQERPPRSI